MIGLFDCWKRYLLTVWSSSSSTEIVTSYWWNDIYKNQWTKFALLILLLEWSVSGVSCIRGHVLCSAGMTGRWRPPLIVWLDYKGMHGYRSWGIGVLGACAPPNFTLCCTWTKYCTSHVCNLVVKVVQTLLAIYTTTATFRAGMMACHLVRYFFTHALNNDAMDHVHVPDE